MENPFEGASANQAVPFNPFDNSSSDEEASNPFAGPQSPQAEVIPNFVPPDAAYPVPHQPVHPVILCQPWDNPFLPAAPPVQEIPPHYAQPGNPVNIVDFPLNQHPGHHPNQPVNPQQVQHQIQQPQPRQQTPDTANTAGNKPTADQVWQRLLTDETPQRQQLFHTIIELVPGLNREVSAGAGADAGIQESLHLLLKQAHAVKVDLFQLLNMFDEYEVLCKEAQEQGHRGEFLNGNSTVQARLCRIIPSLIKELAVSAYDLLDPTWLLQVLEKDERIIARLLPHVADTLLHQAPDFFKDVTTHHEHMLRCFAQHSGELINQGGIDENVHRCTAILLFQFLTKIPSPKLDKFYFNQADLKKEVNKVKVWKDIARQVTDLYDLEANPNHVSREAHLQVFKSLLEFFHQFNPNRLSSEVLEVILQQIKTTPLDRRFEYFVCFFMSKLFKPKDRAAESLTDALKKFLQEQTLGDLTERVIQSPQLSSLPKELYPLIMEPLKRVYSADQMDNDFIKDLLSKGRRSHFYKIQEAVSQLRTTYAKFDTDWRSFVTDFVDKMVLDYEISKEDYQQFMQNQDQEDREFVTRVLLYRAPAEDGANDWVQKKLAYWMQLYDNYERCTKVLISIGIILSELGSQNEKIKDIKEQKGNLKFAHSVLELEIKYPKIIQLIVFKDIPELRMRLTSKCNPDDNLITMNTVIDTAMKELGANLLQIEKTVDIQQYKDYKDLLSIDTGLMKDLLRDLSKEMEDPQVVLNMLAVIGTMQADLKDEKQAFDKICSSLKTKFQLTVSSNPWEVLEQFKIQKVTSLTRGQLSQLTPDAAAYIYHRSRKNSSIKALEACSLIFERLELEDKQQWAKFSKHIKNGDNNQIPENVKQLLQEGLQAFTDVSQQQNDLFAFFNELLGNQALLKKLAKLEPHKEAILEILENLERVTEFDVNEAFNGNTQVLFEKDPLQNTYKGWLANDRPPQGGAFEGQNYARSKKVGKTAESLDSLCSRLQNMKYYRIEDRDEELFDKRLISLNKLIQNILKNLNTLDEYGYQLSQEHLSSEKAAVKFLKDKSKSMVVSIKATQPNQHDEKIADLERLNELLNLIQGDLEERILRIAQTPAKWVLGLRATQRELLTGYIREPKNRGSMETLNGEFVSILQFASGVMDDPAKTLANFKHANDVLLRQPELEKKEPFDLLSKLQAISQGNQGNQGNQGEKEGYKGAKIRFGSYENDNKYLSLMVYAVNNHQTLRELHASQFLFANQLTTSGEIKSFLTYAMSAKKCFYIMDIDLLLPHVRRELISCACTTHQSFSSKTGFLTNSQVMLFIGHGDQLKLKDEFSKYPNVFAAVNKEDLRYNKEFKDENKSIPQFRDSLRITVVSSKSAGLGKSHYIRSRTNFLLEMMLSGEISLDSLSRRFSIIHKGLESFTQTANKPSLATKLDMMERFQDNSWMVDQLLFQMIILKCVPYKKGFLNLSFIEHNYIEIGNNYKEILLKLPFIKFIAPENPEIIGRKYEITGMEMSDNLRFVPVVQAKFFAIANALAGHDDSSLHKISLKNPEQWAQILEMFKDGAPSIKEDYPRILNFKGLQEKAMRARLQAAYLQKIDDLPESQQPKLENGNMAQLVAFVHILFHQISMMDSNYQLNLGQHDWADPTPAVQQQLKETAAARKDLMNLICKLSCKFVWSNTHSLQQDSKNMKALDKELKNFDQEMAVILKKYREKLTGVTPWSKSDKFAVIFSEGAMKVFYKQIKDIPQSIDGVIRNILKQKLLEHSNLSERDKQSYFLDQLMQAFNMMFTEDLCNNFIGTSTKNSQDKKIVDYLVKISGFQSKKGFVFNEDNFLKMMLIRQKVQVLQPVVIIGATGCGKTYLISFLVKMILREEIITMTLHSGVTEADLSRTVIDAIDKSLVTKEKQVWVFFDEFNTSPLQSLIQELVISRKCSFCPDIRTKLDGKPLPHNIVFVLICNPLRVKKSDTNVGLIHENSATAFTHRVYPIPDALLNYAWDFGQLTSEVEKKYIEPAFTPKQGENGAAQIDPSESKLLTECVGRCHEFLREKEGENSVSLRDVQRVKDIYHFLQTFLTPLKLPHAKGYVFVCTIYLNYFLRIGGMKERDELNKVLVEICKAANLPVAVFGDFSKANINFNDMFKQVAEKILDDINLTIDLKQRQIIRNTALKETVFALVVSVLTKTPIMICGKPGSSKTLSTTVVKEFLGLHPNKRTDSVLFKSQPKVIFELFNGSVITRSDDVDRFFKKCGEIYDHENVNLRPDQPRKAEVVFLFDEMGLAEIGYDNPLKVLHPLLESEDRKVGFIGISNWKLDLSKMSRALFVARPDPSEQDLADMVRDDDLGIKLGVIPDIGNYLAQTYLEFIANEFAEQTIFESSRAKSKNPQDQEEASDKDLDRACSRYFHPYFFGLRDFYHLIKYLRRNIDLLGTGKDSAATVIKFIFNGIQRNFSGKLSQYYNKTEGNELRRKGVYSSCRIFLDILFFKLKKVDVCQPYFKEIPTEPLATNYNLDVIRLISQNLVDHSSEKLNRMLGSIQEGSRHLMLFYENPTILTNLKEKLSQFFFSSGYSSQDITDYNGIGNTEDLSKKVQNLPTILRQRHVLFLQDTEELYSCLYEVLNQYYGQSQDRKCKIHVDNGAKSEEVQVHEDFRIVIFMNKIDQDVKDFKNKHPPPFLNRCEKHLVMYDDIIDPEQQERKKLLETEFNKYRKTEGGSKQILIHGYSQEVLYSLVLGDEEFKNLSFKATNMSDYIKALTGKNPGMATSHVSKKASAQDLIKERSEALKKLKERMHTLFSREMFLEMVIAQKNADLSSMAETFVTYHPFDSLAGYLDGFLSKGGKDNRLITFFTKNTLLYTFSSSWEVKQIAESQRFKKEVKVRSCLDFKKDINKWQDTIKSLVNHDKPDERALLIITFESRREWTIIPKLREAIDKLARNSMKHVLLIAHYTQQDIADPNKEVETSITFASGNWNLASIDNLRNSDYKWFTSSLKSETEDVIANALASTGNRDKRDPGNQTQGGNEIIHKLEQNLLEKLRKMFRIPPNISNEELFVHTNDFFGLILQAVQAVKDANRSETTMNRLFYQLVEEKRRQKLADHEQSHFELTMQCIKEIVDSEVASHLKTELDTLENLVKHETNKVIQSAKFGPAAQAKTVEKWLAEASKILIARIEDPSMEPEEEEGMMNARARGVEAATLRIDVVERGILIKAADRVRQANEKLCAELGNSGVRERKVIHKREACSQFSEMFKQAKRTLGIQKPPAQTQIKLTHEEKLISVFEQLNSYLQKTHQKLPTDTQVRFMAKMLEVFIKKVNPDNTESRLLDLESTENMAVLLILFWEVYNPDIILLPEQLTEEKCEALIEEFQEGMFINSSVSIVQNLRTPVTKINNKDDLSKIVERFENQLKQAENLKKVDRFKPELAVVQTNIFIARHLETVKLEQDIQKFSQKLVEKYNDPQQAGNPEEQVPTTEFAIAGLEFLLERYSRQPSVELQEVMDRSFKLLRNFILLLDLEETKENALRLYKSYLEITGKALELKHLQAFTDMQSKVNLERRKDVAIDELIANEDAQYGADLDVTVPVASPLTASGVTKQPTEDEKYQQLLKFNSAKLKSEQTCVEERAFKEGRPSAQRLFADTMQELSRILMYDLKQNANPKWRKAASAYYFATTFLRIDRRPDSMTNAAPPEADISVIDSLIAEGLQSRTNPAAVVLFREMIKNYQADERLFKNHGLVRLPEFLIRIFSNRDLRRMTDLIADHQSAALVEFTQMLQNPATRLATAEALSHTDVEKAAIFAKVEIFDNFTSDQSILEFSYNPENDTVSHLHRVIWAYFHWKRVDKTPMSIEVQEKYLLLAHTAILVGNIEEAQRTQVAARVKLLQAALHDLEEKAKIGASKLKDQIVDDETVMHEAETPDVQVYESLAYPRFLKQFLTAITAFHQPSYCSDSEVDQVSKIIKTLVNELSLPSKLSYVRLRLNLMRLCTKFVFKPVKSHDAKLELQAIDQELQNILNLGKSTQNFVAKHLSAEIDQSAELRNGLLALELLDDKYFTEAKSVKVFGRNWVPTRYNLLQYLANQEAEPQSMQTSTTDYLPQNSLNEKAAQAKFIAKLSEKAQVYALYSNLLLAIQQLCKAMKTHICQSVTGNEALKIKISEYIGEEVRDEKAPPGMPSELQYRGQNPLQEDIQRTWIEFRARWRDFLELKTSAPEVFEFCMEDNRGVSLHIFDNQEESDRMLKALLSADSVLAYFLIPPMDYVKNNRPKDKEVKIPDKEIGKVLSLMRGITNELVYIHNWFVRSLHRLVFSEKPAPENKRALRAIPFMSFKSKVLPKLQEMQFQNLIERCAEVRSDGKVIFKAYEELSYLWDQNSEMRLITPLGYKENNVFAFKDSQPINLRNQFIKRLYKQAKLNLRDHMSFFNKTRSEILGSIERQVLEIGKIPEILNKLNSLCDDLDPDIEQNEEMTLVELFGESTRNIYGFTTVQRRHLIHYITCLGECQLKDIASQDDRERERRNKARIEKQVKDKATKYLEEHFVKDVQSRVSLNQVQMELTYWYYMQSLNIHNTNALSFIKSMSDSGYFDHLRIYEQKKDEEKSNLVLSFLEGYYQKESASKKIQSMEPNTAVPEMTILIEYLVKHIANTTAKEQRQEVRNPMDDDNMEMDAPREDMMIMDD